MPWAVKWRSENRLDGKRENLVGRFFGGAVDPPAHMKGYTLTVFESRDSAREFIKSEFGYIAARPDLRCEPHGWRRPVVVKVEVFVREVA
jgi:hypothetical protein